MFEHYSFGVSIERTKRKLGVYKRKINLTWNEMPYVQKKWQKYNVEYVDRLEH